jgi:DNA gyrase subunit A
LTSDPEQNNDTYQDPLEQEQIELVESFASAEDPGDERDPDDQDNLDNSDNPDDPNQDLEDDSEENPRVESITIEDQMKISYINYAMSVIIGRAIPDVRDGLKPVHRRSLFSMWEMNNTHDKPYKKSARVVGDVMGKYHPHGDASIYDTIVRMAQPFSYRMMLADGQGNFGSVDGDEPAAMRYTEIRLFKQAEELLHDLDKETVPFVPNFDESSMEPAVLPAKIPNLLINGSEGIAVGMATKMPPHNLREICSGIIHYISHPESTVEDLIQFIPGPDFPTGGVIHGTTGIRQAYQTGYGKILVRGVAEIVEGQRKHMDIVISEIPYQVNKARLIEHIAELVREKRIEGISDLRDESDKDGMRIVIELKKDGRPQIILNQLYKHTALESTFGIINLSIVDKMPKVLGLIGLINEFLKHRIIVVTKRSEFEKRKAQQRVHILMGLLHAIDNIDAVIALIRGSETVDAAKTSLMEQFELDSDQSTAILQMQLRRLAALEKQKLIDEKISLQAEIDRLTELLSSEQNIKTAIASELQTIADTYSDDRRTQIVAEYSAIEKEELIPNKQVLVTLTHRNYVKQIGKDAYRTQRRGGIGVSGISIKDDDYVEQIFVANTHDYLLCFTSTGRAYWLKVYDIPEGSRQSKGKAIINLLNLKEDERISSVIPVASFEEDRYFLFTTKQGMTIKIPQNEFSRPRSTGVNAVGLREEDELIDVMTIEDDAEIIITTSAGQGLRFHVKNISVRHRGALGVIGIRMHLGDEERSVTKIEEGKSLLVMTSGGYGKRTDFDAFRGHGRGTMGVRNIRSQLTGGVITTRAVAEDDEIILMSADGTVMRTPVNKISLQGRNTRGVRVMRLRDDDRLIGLTVLSPEERNQVQDIPECDIDEEEDDAI